MRMDSLQARFHWAHQIEKHARLSDDVGEWIDLTLHSTDLP